MELLGVAKEYDEAADEPTLSEFLQQVSLYSDQDSIDEEGGKVTLMTLHNAKGLEFRAVYMIGMEEGVFPHARSLEEGSLEEERRLCYVGLTRARERLTLTHASARALYGSRNYNLPSRFIDELPQDEIERDRLRPDVVVGLRRADGDAEARGRVPGPLHGRHGAPRDDGRGRRDADRVGRHRHGAFRRRRLRAAADARVRAARTRLSAYRPLTRNPPIPAAFSAQ